MGFYEDSDYDDGSINLPMESLPILLDWLAQHPLIMHHAKFDCHICAAGHRLDRSTGRDLSRAVFWDTQHVNGLLWPLESSSLKPTLKRLYGEDEGDAQVAIQKELKRQGKGLTWRYDLLTWGCLSPYAARDANQTYRLWEYQQEVIEEGAYPKGFEDVRLLELRLMRCLFDMERRGIGFAKDEAYAEYLRLKARIDEARDALPFRPTVPGAQKHFGVPSVAKDVMRDLAKSPATQVAADAQQWITYQGYLSAASKWYRGWPAATGSDGRLRCNYRQMRIESDRPGGKTGGAVSGRLSVERVQLQAIPHAHQIPEGIVPIRKFFRSKPGHDNWSLDISQAEVRVATSISRCQGMLDVLLAGTDVHGETARKVFGVKPGDDDWDAMRAVAKRLTFGILYGAGIDTLREQIRLFTGQDYSRNDTRSLKNRYDDEFPEFTIASHQAMQRADKGLGGRGYLTMKVTGRRRVFGYGERTHKAWNAVIQGTVAELMKLWMVEVNETWPGWLLLQTHDDLVLEVPHGQEHALDKIKTLGINTFRDRLVAIGGLDVPFKIDQKRWTDAA
jgi:DNA polymerase I-like protein with 3'-5' exonuclease and polymerase domains